MKQQQQQQKRKFIEITYKKENTPAIYFRVKQKKLHIYSNTHMLVIHKHNYIHILYKVFKKLHNSFRKIMYNKNFFIKKRTQRAKE